MDYPVRPEDSVSTQLRVLDKEPIETNLPLGDVRAKTVGTNRDGDVVVSWVNDFPIQRRDAE